MSPPNPYFCAIGARTTTKAAVGPVTWQRDPPSRATMPPPMITVYNPFSDYEFKFFVADVNQKDLEYLAGLVTSGRMRSVIDRTSACFM